jgi:hypothetical protein
MRSITAPLLPNTQQGLLLHCLQQGHSLEEGKLKREAIWPMQTGHRQRTFWNEFCDGLTQAKKGAGTRPVTPSLLPTT